MKRPASIALVVCLAATSVAQVPVLPIPAPILDLRNFIVFKDRAFVVGNPILVAGPSVTNPTWSPTGQFLLYEAVSGESNVLAVQEDVREQRPAMRNRSLYVYSLSTGRSVELTQFRPQQHYSVGWFAGTDRALVAVQELVMDDSTGRPESNGALYMLDASVARISDFTPWDGEGKLAFVLLSPSPTQPYAFIDAQLEHRGFTSDGRPQVTAKGHSFLIDSRGNSTPLQLAADALGVMTAWSPDGTQAYAMVTTPQNKGNRDWYSISLSN